MNILEKVLENPGRINVVKKIFYIGIVLIALFEIATIYIFHLGHGHFWFENLPAYGSIFGLISCLLIIAAAKFLGHYLLQKKEDYYD